MTMPLNELAAAILLSKRVGYEVIEQTCRLVLADVEFNRWAASMKTESAPVLTQAQWLAILDAGENILSRLERAWVAYQAAEWPRGRHDIGLELSRNFAAELRSCRLEFDALGTDFGRPLRKTEPK